MSKPKNSETNMAREQRARNEARIEAILEENEPMTVIEIAAAADMARSTVERHITRMRREGIVRKVEEMGFNATSKRNSSMFTLGIEDDAKPPLPPIVVSIHRHPQDVALFGEYRSAA